MPFAVKGVRKGPLIMGELYTGEFRHGLGLGLGWGGAQAARARIRTCSPTPPPAPRTVTVSGEGTADAPEAPWTAAFSISSGNISESKMVRDGREGCVVLRGALASHRLLPHAPNTHAHACAPTTPPARHLTIWCALSPARSSRSRCPRMRCDDDELIVRPAAQDRRPLRTTQPRALSRSHLAAFCLGRSTSSWPRSPCRKASLAPSSQKCGRYLRPHFHPPTPPHPRATCDPPGSRGWQPHAHSYQLGSGTAGTGHASLTPPAAARAGPAVPGRQRGRHGLEPCQGPGRRLLSGLGVLHGFVKVASGSRPEP